MSIAPAKLEKKDVIKVYTQTARVYDIWGSMTETKSRQIALDMAQIKDCMSVLEVAIGTGLTFQEILKGNPNGQNIGVDLTPAMLEKARSRMRKLGLTHYQVSLGDAYDLEFCGPSI